MPVVATQLRADNTIGLRRQIGLSAGERSDTLRHLSTGLRITTGRDDPAGLIAGENLASEGRKIDEAVKNADRARALADTIDAALGQINDRLRQVGRLLSHSANEATPAERRANQLEVDALLEDVDGLIQHTTHNGRPVLRELPTPPTPVPTIDFSTKTFTPVPGQSGVGGYPDAATVTNGGRSVTISGNGWFHFDVGSYTVTPDTRLSFTFASGDAGEDIIVKPEDADPSFTNGAFFGNRRYQLAGTQVVPVDTTYYGPAGTRQITIDLSQNTVADFNGETITHMIFSADDDADGSGAVTFTDVRLFEDVPPQQVPRTVEFALGQNLRGGRQGGMVEFDLPGLSLTSLGTLTTPLHELRSGGDHDASSDLFVEAARSVDQAIKQIATERGRVGAFARHTVDATQRNMREAALQNAGAGSTVRDTRFAEATAALARSDVLRQSQTDLFDVHRQQATRVLDLLG